MRRVPFLAFAVAAFLSTCARADEPMKEISDKQFRRLVEMLLENPTNKEEAETAARAIVFYSIQTPKVAIVLGAEELKWIQGEKRSLLLLAAYSGGNALSQLHSGVKQNDRYSGLLTLFGVYRQLQEEDTNFKVAAVEELLKLQNDGKLMAHILEMEKKEPTRLSKEDQEALEKLLKEMK